MKNTKIGLFGGTFNPIHIGHLVLAQFVLEKLKLAQVIFIPSYLPPHKSGRNIISAKDRYHMVKLAVQSNDHFAISDFEIKKRGKSYTIHTVQYMLKKYSKGTKIFFIIGEDNATELHTWKNIKQLSESVTFVAVNRPGTLQNLSKVRVKNVTMPILDISASEIRARIAQGKSAKYYLPENVLQYIKNKKLYMKQ